MRRIKTDSPSQQWYNDVKKRGFTADYTHPQTKHLEPLKQKLLEIGGWAVCLPVFEEDYDKIMTRGRRFPRNKKMIRGENNQCHNNSTFLWDEFGYQICTGYALTKDGMWRQHSWCFHDNTVIETTVSRVQYFGFIMTHEEAEQFFWDNY
jgi:hypothetical protein